jgi:hypothetical protein
LQALRRGDDPSKAARAGFDAMAGNRNIVINDARVKAVLPRSIDGVAVNENDLVFQLEESLSDLSKFDIDYTAFPSPQLSDTDPKMRDQIMKQRVDAGIENGGFWTMDKSGRNMVLMVQLADGSALPVTNKKGLLISVPIIEAQNMGAESQKYTIDDALAGEGAM